MAACALIVSHPYEKPARCASVVRVWHVMRAIAFRAARDEPNQLGARGHRHEQRTAQRMHGLIALERLAPSPQA